MLHYIVAASIASCALSANEIKVVIQNLNNPPLCLGGTTTLWFDEGAPINISIAPCIEHINVFAPNTLDDIGPIHIGGSTPINDFSLLVSSGTLDISTPNATYTAAGGNLGGITADAAIRPFLRVGGHVRGDLTGPTILPDSDGLPRILLATRRGSG